MFLIYMCRVEQWNLILLLRGIHSFIHSMYTDDECLPCACSRHWGETVNNTFMTPALQSRYFIYILFLILTILHIRHGYFYFTGQKSKA